ncbi:hypothetical protein INR49_015646 [Caranx melampygus]|nr:hypothetical protein INR49_015646 [Caranx melampygus]
MTPRQMWEITVMALSWNMLARPITIPVKTTPVLLTFFQYTRSTTAKQDVGGAELQIGRQ